MTTPSALAPPVGVYGRTDGFSTLYVAELWTTMLLAWFTLPVGASTLT